MSATRPPRLATWLMSRLVSGEHAESLIGDLMERHRDHSVGWYWRQAIDAIIRSFVFESWTHRGLMLSVLAFSAYLDDLYMLIWKTGLISRLSLWYPHLINWLLALELNGVTGWPSAVRHVAYDLRLEALTSTVSYCVLLMVSTRLITRLRPARRGQVMTMLLVTQVGLCLPYLRGAFSNWLREPGRVMWALNLFWYSGFTFVAIPFSIFFGARTRMNREGIPAN
jgi:hypothetical protein